MKFPKESVLAAVVAIAIAAPALVVHAQVGKSQGVVDANTAAETALAGMPHMTAAIAKALVGVRPFKSITELNTFLVGQGLTQKDAMDFYQKAFVHINLNTATRDEILLVPGAGTRMVREFAEDRPWMSSSVAVLRFTGMKQYCASFPVASAPTYFPISLSNCAHHFHGRYWGNSRTIRVPAPGTRRISSRVAVFRLMCTNAFW